jgi:hypothetical protein
MDTVNKLRNQKSPGNDGIPNELLKYGGPKLLELTKLLMGNKGYQKNGE